MHIGESPEIMEFVNYGKLEDFQMKDKIYDEHIPLQAANQLINEGKLFNGKLDVPRLFPEEGSTLNSIRSYTFKRRRF
jgi:hypothetical protein